MIWIALGIMITAWICLMAARIIRIHTSLVKKDKRYRLRTQRRKIYVGLRLTGLSLCFAGLVIFLIFEFSAHQI